MFAEIYSSMWRYINNPYDVRRRSSIFAHILNLKDVVPFQCFFLNQVSSQHNRSAEILKAPNPYPWLHMTCDFILRSHVIKLNKFPPDVTAKSEQKKHKIKTLKSFIFISSRILFFSLRKGERRKKSFILCSESCFKAAERWVYKKSFAHPPNWQGFGQHAS